jgi:hypothetical protein
MVLEADVVHDGEDIHGTNPEDAEHTGSASTASCWWQSWCSIASWGPMGSSESRTAEGWERRLAF